MLALYAAPAGASGSTLSARVLRSKATDNNGYNEPLCQSRTSLCIDSYDNPGDDYVGHDEPSLEFKSNVPGSDDNVTSNPCQVG